MFTLKGMCAKIQKVILFATKRRNDFHIFLKLTVDCENKLLKSYCVLSLQLQNFILPNFLYQYRPWIAFLLQQFIGFWRLTLPTLKLYCNMFHLSATRYRINFHILFSLTVSCEKKLLKMYYAVRLHSQDFISLKFRHPYMPWIFFLLQ